MEHVLSLASGLTPILQVLLIIVLAIIFWEPIAQRIGWKEKKETVPEWAAKLMEYYNHSTTDKLDEIHDDVKSANQSLDEIKKYGVHMRKQLQ